MSSCSHHPRPQILFDICLSISWPLSSTTDVLEMNKGSLVASVGLSHKETAIMRTTGSYVPLLSSKPLGTHPPYIRDLTVTVNLEQIPTYIIHLHEA